MSHSIFPERRTNLFPGATGSLYGMLGSSKSPLFLIDNILSKSGEKDVCGPKVGNCSNGPFSSPNSMMEALCMGQHGHDIPRLLSSFPHQSPFFPAGCLPFPLFNPSGLHSHDMRTFLQNTSSLHNPYGFKANHHALLNMNNVHPYFQGPTSRPLHKRKGGQVRFSNDQTLDLEQKFKRQKYLTPPERKKLAKSLTLSERQIKTWFQNRRAKWRRSKDGEQTDCDHDISSPGSGEAGSGVGAFSSKSSEAFSPATATHVKMEEEHRVKKDTHKQQSRAGTGFSSQHDPIPDHRREMDNSRSDSCSDDEEDIIDT